MSAPRVVALGGGHGTAVSLRAARRYAGELTAIVSAADDGGSSGRLRDLLGVPALGDLRKCLAAVAADDSRLAAILEVRYEEGSLAGHAVGNLLLAGLLEATGDLVTAVGRAGELLQAVGCVLPATTVPTELRARLREGSMVGQVAIGREESVEEVSILPEGARPPAAALAALVAAEQIVIGPGSLYTSVLAAVAVPGIAPAIAASPAKVVYVCNLEAHAPETLGYSVADHLRALERHDVAVDVVLCDTAGHLELGSPEMAVVDTDLRGSNGLVHEPGKLAVALAGLV
jgi:uncharacterized cofD-like protein